MGRNTERKKVKKGGMRDMMKGGMRDMMMNMRDIMTKTGAITMTRVKKTTTTRARTGEATVKAESGPTGGTASTNCSISGRHSGL